MKRLKARETDEKRLTNRRSAVPWRRRRFMRRAVWGLMLLMVMGPGAGCRPFSPESEDDGAASVRETPPAPDANSSSDADRPGEAPAAPPPPPPRVEIDTPDVEEESSWLSVRGVRPDEPVAWATGDFDPARNKITVMTHQVRRFSLDTDRIGLNWDHPVILRIDGYNSQLRRRENPVILFEVTPTGEWEVVKKKP